MRKRVGLWTDTGDYRKDAAAQTIRTLAGHQHIVACPVSGPVIARARIDHFQRL